jgi:AGCS family alanine or glycine:cation symporter
MLQNEKKGGRLSSLRALSIALAGTLGVGNISGVVSAICLGGAGAIFWMWIGAIFSMIIKYSEVVLAVRYRRRTADGYIGGAMYYMPHKFLAILFSILCIIASFSIGNFLQVQAISSTLSSVCQINPVHIGLILAILVYLSIHKGIHSVSKVTSVLVPIMSFLYTTICLIVIFSNPLKLLSVLKTILLDAFQPLSAIGGITGLLLSKGVHYGILRGILSNEAGCGTAPIAHAGADTNCEVRQGFWGIFEVFADTIIMCSLSAFVLLYFQDNFPDISGMELMICCFSSVIGSSAGILVATCILFFAFATIVGWSYYGKVSLEYLTKSKKIRMLYYILYSTGIIVGVMMPEKFMWNLADITIGSMAIINTIVILTKRQEIVITTQKFFKKENTAHSSVSIVKSL